MGSGAYTTRLPSGSVSSPKRLAAPEQGGWRRLVHLEDEAWAATHRIGPFRTSNAILTAPAASGRAGVGHGVLEAGQRVGGRHQAPGLLGGGDVEGQREGRNGVVRYRGPARSRRRTHRPGGPRGARGAPGRRSPCRACRPGPPCPGGGPWRATGRSILGCRRSRRRRRRRRRASRSLPRRRRRTASVSAGARRGRAGRRATPPCRPAREPDVAGGIARPDEHRAGRGAAAGGGKVAEGRRHEQAERARTDDGDDVARCDRRAEHRVHGAGHGLDGDRVLVGELIGHGIELAWSAPRARRVDQPPPVSAQKPVWRPGRMWPKAT